MLDADLDVSGEDEHEQSDGLILLELLAELKRAAKTTELAARLDMHPNGVRIHLERLEQAGLVVRARLRGRRGRPADAWTIAPDARPGGEPPRAHRDLGRRLARSIDEQSTDIATLERTGPEIGRELAPDDAGPGLEAVEHTLAGLGFAPYAQRGHRLTVCLGNCPYRGVVRENQAAICPLRKGDHSTRSPRKMRCRRSGSCSSSSTRRTSAA